MRGRVSLHDLSIASGLPVGQLRKLRKGEGLEDARGIALALGVTPSTVRRWRSKGVPDNRIAEVGNLLADRIAAEKVERKERAKVKKLVTKARGKGLLPKPAKSGSRRFGGKIAAGFKTISKLNRYLDVDALETIRELTMQAPKGPHYIVTVLAVEAGITGKVRGYRAQFTQKLGKQAENIAFGSAITSGTHSNRREALSVLFHKLKEAIDDSDALVYLIELTVFSYHYKETDYAKSMVARRMRGKR